MKKLSNEKNKGIKDLHLGSESSKFDALRGYMFLFIFLGISVFLIVVIILPSYRSINDTKAKIKRNEERRTKVSAQANYLRGLENLQGQLQENIDLALSAFPEEEEVPDLFNQILQMSDESGISLSALSYGGSTEENGLGSLKAQVVLSGTYEDVLNFIRIVEESRRILSMDNFRIQISEEEEYILNVTLTAYYMPSVNAESVSIEQIMAKPRLENVIAKLYDQKYYDPGQYDLPLGTDNPFVIETYEDNDNPFLSPTPISPEPTPTPAGNTIQPQ